MRSLILSIVAFLFSVPAFASIDCSADPSKCNCMVVIWHDASQAEPDDLSATVLNMADFRQLTGLALQNGGRKVLGVMWFPVVRGTMGPRAYDVLQLEWQMSMRAIPGDAGDPRPGLYYGMYWENKSILGLQNDEGWRSQWRISRDGIEDTTQSFVQTDGVDARTAVTGSEIVLLKGTESTDQTLQSRGFVLGSGAIRDDIMANGC